MPLPAFMTGRTHERRKNPKVLSVAAMLLVAGCGQGHGSGNTAAATKTAAAPSSASEAAPPFKVTRDWSFLAKIPPRSVSMKTMDECLTRPFWQDADGKREPAAHEDPLVVYADGSCNSPVTDTRVGGYSTPHQAGPATVVLHNGDPIGVECWAPGDPIQDVRGAASSSPVWIGGVVIQGGKQLTFLIPEVNAGYVDESKLDPCQTN